MENKLKGKAFAVSFKDRNVGTCPQQATQFLFTAAECAEVENDPKQTNQGPNQKATERHAAFATG
jgi:hypothetical protein